MVSVFLKKSKERLTVAFLSFEREYLNATVSNAYYSVFNAMQFLLGDPPGKRWKHGGVVKSFLKLCRDRGLAFSVEVDKLAYELYQLRRVADYGDRVIEDRKQVRELLQLAETFIREVEDAGKKMD